MAKANKKIQKTKAEPAPKVVKQIEKKQPKAEKAEKKEKPASRPKDKQKTANNRKLLNINVDAKILSIVTTTSDKKQALENFRQVATQLGIDVKTLHGRKEVLDKLSTSDKKKIQDAQKVDL